MQTAFLIRVNGRLKNIPFDDVLFITARDNYCEIVTIKKKKWLTQVTMHSMEEMLPQNLFLRVHRSYIISLSKIDWLDGNNVEIDEYKIPVSKAGHKGITKRSLIICPEHDKKLKNEIERISVNERAENGKNK